MYLHIKHFFEKLVLPISQDEDGARSEFILNIFLAAVIGLSFVSFTINLIDWFRNKETAISAGVMFIIFSFFIFLYFLSRKGFFILASFIFLGVLFLLVSYVAIIYGVDLPEGVLTYALVIIMSGILISTRFAFCVAFIVVFITLLFGYFQIHFFLPMDYSWRTEATSIGNIIMIGILFSVIATVSWLSNREIEKSLARARRSEVDLKKERDSLEITVEARTRELKETQAEKMTQLYRFAEFGRLSSGLFHDLINPLTAVSLNIEKVKNMEEVRAHVKSVEEKTGAVPISELSEYVSKAISAAKKMEDMVSAVRKQLSRQETKSLFSVNEEIAQALEVLSYKAKKSCVAIRLFSREDLKTYGDAVKFNQVALNLIANAIDAYLPAIAPPATITMSLSKEGGMIIFEVKDRGIGISEENKPRLFDPFFTTKEEGYGLGIGLSIVKRIVEKDFGGSIEVASREGEGSTFTVKFPQKDNG